MQFTFTFHIEASRFCSSPSLFTFCLRFFLLFHSSLSLSLFTFEGNLRIVATPIEPPSTPPGQVSQLSLFTFTLTFHLSEFGTLHFHFWAIGPSDDFCFTFHFLPSDFPTSPSLFTSASALKPHHSHFSLIRIQPA